MASERNGVMSKHIVIQFVRFGPYHFTRLRSAMDALGPLGWRVTGLQTAGTDETYAWDDAGLDSAALATVFPGRSFGELAPAELRKGMTSALDKLRPDAVAIAGWGFPDARAALDWCTRHGAKSILMSETRASDGRRFWWKEWLKRRVIRRVDGALVGGQAHKDYLMMLGVPAEKIETGYDVVDNQLFARECAKWRGRPGDGVAGSCGASVDRWFGKPVFKGSESGERRVASEELGVKGGKVGKPETGGQRSDVGRISSPYFLASSRFIERKNLRTLVDAYADYRRRSLDSSLQPWGLVLLGTGDGREKLERYVKKRGIEGLEFPGFQQIDTLPRWYAGAGAFVHPALEEPWGLVINEAMASGLPVLCSRTTGASELVEDGVNGFLFDPRDAAQIAGLLARMAGSSPDELARMGAFSSRLVDERAPLLAFGRGLAKILSNQ